MIKKEKPNLTEEVINTFLQGHDETERIINLECGYNDKTVKVYYRNEQGIKCVKEEGFYPFAWAKHSTCLRLCGGDRNKVKQLMTQYGIGVKLLTTSYSDFISDRMRDGYSFIFYAHSAMTYNNFLKFFKECDNPIYPNEKESKKTSLLENEDVEVIDTKQYLCVTPAEQFMISTGKRLFKGYEDYDDLTRLIFDLETGGLDPHTSRINQIGIRTNKGYEKILTTIGETEEEKDESELSNIETFFKIVYTLKPDVITGQNSENFDWDFYIVRCEELGVKLSDLTKKYFGGRGVKKRSRQSVLKLGGETEYFFQTSIYGINTTDTLHAIRRAQAIDSNMQSANLKYVTKYSKLNKPNRVYVDGDKISSTWSDFTASYAHNDTNGEWYKISDEMPLIEGFNVVSGKYIVERYLLDDLYETDKVELRYNQSNFLLNKLIPTLFSKACIMGTASTWKMLMLAWSYENGLAIPAFSESRSFTGGLSRLLSVGYVDRVVKLDYNSLYPSIILTWMIESDMDITGVMLALLEFILTSREKYKDLTKKAGKQARSLKDKMGFNIENLSNEEIISLKEEILKFERESSANDKKQLPFKIFANSFFGGFGAPNLFNWGDTNCAEETTCIGRQALRLMVRWFNDKGYTAIVGDTDGFNFKMPPAEVLNNRIYIGKGLNRNTKVGVEYKGVEADVAEFNDLFMRGKMGLGIDEYAQATINFSRKNYADLLDDGKIKLVGNTIKSKKMSGYIEKFLKNGIEMLLNNKGKDFLDYYYSYIKKIYNYQIPLRDIASKGKIKQTIKNYKKDCSSVTKAGNLKSRQAHYELAIKDNLKVDLGDTIYYINTGTSKSHADVKKVTKYFDYDNEGNKIQIDKNINKGFKEVQLNGYLGTKKDYIKESFPNHFVEEEILMNSVRLDNSVVESPNDTFCEDGMEYNVPKYIDQFNKRITPLLVCFSKNIRKDILITNPNDAKYFTEEESMLTSGEPDELKDQDTYEELMIMEEKEISFWKSVNKTPPFITEAKMVW